MRERIKRKKVKKDSPLKDAVLRMSWDMAIASAIGFVLKNGVLNSKVTPQSPEAGQPGTNK